MECGDGMSDKRNTERKKGTEEEEKKGLNTVVLTLTAILQSGRGN